MYLGTYWVACHCDNSVIKIYLIYPYLKLPVTDDEDAKTVLEVSGGGGVLAEWLVFKAPARVVNTFKTLSVPPVPMPESTDSPCGYYTAIYINYAPLIVQTWKLRD